MHLFDPVKLDAKLWAVDADSGKPCRDFGTAGRVDLLQGLGEVREAEYYPTSAPMVVGDIVAKGPDSAGVAMYHAGKKGELCASVMLPEKGDDAKEAAAKTSAAVNR